MSYMISRCFTFHEYIICIDLCGPPDLVLEHPVYKMLICSSSILKSKGHHNVTIQPSVGNEGCLGLMSFMHPNLVIAIICVHKAEEFTTYCRVNQLINLR